MEKLWFCPELNKEEPGGWRADDNGYPHCYRHPIHNYGYDTPENFCKECIAETFLAVKIEDKFTTKFHRSETFSVMEDK